MSFRRILIVVLAVSFVSMWLVSLYCYTLLPARIPTHYDAAGVPDAFAAKTIGMALALPTTFTVLTGIFVAMAVGLPALAARYSRFLNVPNKEQFLKLSVESRTRALEPMRDLSLMMPVPLSLLAIYMAWGTSEIALGRASSLSAFPILVVLLSSFVCLAVTVQRMQKSVAAESAG
jgi:uncharacterized membrane protein